MTESEQAAKSVIDKVGATIKSALEKSTPRMPLRRHHDDDYVDRIEISDASGASLQAYIVPRYKTSDLSGDEWRIHAQLKVDWGEHSVVDRHFHRMKDLTKYAPFFLWSDAKGLLSGMSAILVAERKGVVLFKQSFATFGDAAIGMGWHLVLANEGTSGVEWHHLSDAEERAHCQQVGCAEPPKNFFHIKKLQVSPSESLMIEPAYDFTGQYTWYCARHTRRGDCGLEDADNNLVLVDGNGVAIEHARDESPSAFGGAIEVDLP